MIHKRVHHRRGVAMLLVLGVIAMAAVLGYAMLASASLQKQVGANAAASVGAQGMAESGANLAIYYLQYPEEWTNYPTTYTEQAKYDRDGTFWTGTNGQFVEVGSPAVGSMKVKVTRDQVLRWKYKIESIGRAAGNSLERKVTATVWINTEYAFRNHNGSNTGYAGMFTNDVTLTAGSRIGQSGQNNGDIYSNGAVRINNLATVWGEGLRRKNLSSAGTPVKGWTHPVPLAPQIIPENLSEIRNYRDYELPTGTMNHAATLAITQMGDGTATPRLEPSTGNPAGVHYAPGNFTLRNNAEVQGTLIVAGDLFIDGSNITIRAKDGFPALLVGGDITFINVLGASNLTVEGVTWVGGKIDATLALAPSFTSTGALLVNGTSPIFGLTLGGKVFLNFDPNRTALPDFSDFGRTRQSVKVISWEGR
ncbi:MAG: hypothetical protein WBD40_25365 [Tepidisphaeraceae bacterium]